MQKQLIYDLSILDLEIWLKEVNQPNFRAKQIWRGIYQHFKDSPDDITTLPLELRQTLGESFSFDALKPVKTIASLGRRTVKTLFRLADGHFIEAVLMHYEARHTLCISVQSGCAVGCSFCATGQMGFKRNLTSGEILAQVLYFARHLFETDDQVTNVVVMGMGEPFHNYEQVMEAMGRLNHPDAFGLGARRITLSTVGIIPRIRQFADENTQFNLAISLHTVDDRLRSKLIPVNKKYPVDALLQACRYYTDKTHRRVSFEYALIDGVNDSLDDAAALAYKLKGMLCHVNLIPLNPTKGFNQQGTSKEKVEAFFAVLEEKHIPVTVRLGRGVEIQAGCGQLATEEKING